VPVETGCFGTVGAPESIAHTGKVFYEVELLVFDSRNFDADHNPYPPSSVQFGWADAGFELHDVPASGVGDDTHSWAFDGRRVKKWHNEETEVTLDSTHGGTRWPAGRKWAVGDVLGFAADLDAGKLWFGHNGQWSLGFEDVRPAGGLYPALTGRWADFRVNFGASRLGRHCHSALPFAAIRGDSRYKKERGGAAE
jgi:hypothetical protein